MSMDRLISRSVPHLPRYQSTSPARSPRLEARRFASLHSVSRISYIDGESYRGIYSYHIHSSPSPKRAYKVHLIQSKPGHHLVRSTKSLSQNDLRSSHVYHSLDALSTKVLQGRDQRVKVTSCEDIYHKKPFFPDLTASESGVSMEGWEDGSLFGGEDDCSSQHSFGSSSAAFDVTLESELDRTDNLGGHEDSFGDFRDGEASDGRRYKRSVRRASGDASSTDSNCSSPVSHFDSKRREFERTRMTGLRVQIPGDEKNGHGQTSQRSSKPLAQSTPHVSPRGKHENKLSVKASWSVDDMGSDEHIPGKTPTSRSPFDLEVHEVDLQNLSRLGESSLNASFSEDTMSDVSNSTITSPILRRRDLERQKSKKKFKSSAHSNEDNFEQDDCGYGTDHYHSQADLSDRKVLSLETLAGELEKAAGKAITGSESWAFLSIDTAETKQKRQDACSGAHEASRSLKPGQVKIPLIAAGKQGQEKLKKGSQLSPPLDRSSPQFSAPSAFHTWTAGHNVDVFDPIYKGVMDNSQRVGEPPNVLTSAKLDHVNELMVDGQLNGISSHQFIGHVCEPDSGLMKDQRPLEDQYGHNDSGLVLLNDSITEGADVQDSKSCGGGAHHVEAGTDYTICPSNKDIHIFNDSISNTNGISNTNEDIFTPLELSQVTCSQTNVSQNRISRHFLKTELENSGLKAEQREIPNGQDDASACDDVTSEIGEWSRADFFNSWDSPMSAGRALTMRQPVDGAIDHMLIREDKETPDPCLASSVFKAGSETSNLAHPTADCNSGEVPVAFINFPNIEDKNSQKTGFDSVTTNDYSSLSHNLLDDNSVYKSKNSLTGIHSCQRLNIDAGPQLKLLDGIATCDVSATDSMLEEGKLTELDTANGQQGGIGENECRYSMPVVEDESIKDGSDARREFSLSQVDRCSNTVDRQDCGVFESFPLTVQDVSVVEITKAETVVEQTGVLGATVSCHVISTDVTQTGRLIDESPKRSETHMACSTRGGDESARGTTTTNPGDKGLCDSTLQPGGDGLLDTERSPRSRGDTSSPSPGVSVITAGGNTCASQSAVPSDHSLALTGNENVITSEMNDAVSNNNVLDNLHQQLFRISSLEDDTETLKEGFRDFALATSVPQEITNEEPSLPVEVMDDSGTYYSYSISVHDPEPEDVSEEPCQREHYDNDDGVIEESRTYTYRRHFPASLLKSNHIKSSSLWTLQEETESLIDAQSPRSSPKRLFGMVASEEDNTSSNSSRPLSPSSNLSNSEERLDLDRDVSLSESDHSKKSHLDHLDTISLVDLTETYTSQPTETSFCGPFPAVSSVTSGRSPLDILSDSLEQFNRDISDDTGLCSSSNQHSWADDLASETSSRIHDFDNELSFISSSISPSPSDFSDGSVYTSTGTAQVKTSGAAFFDYDILVSPSDKSEVKQTQEDTLTTSSLTGTKSSIDKEFEKILEEFTAITSPLADLDQVLLTNATEFDSLYKAFTNDDSEKKQNHVCIVVEEDSMDAFRFKRFLKKSHTKRKKGKKLLRFLTSLGCVSEGAQSPEMSPKKVWRKEEQVLTMDNMGSSKGQLVKPSSFQNQIVLSKELHQPPRENSPTSSSHSLDSERSRPDSAYSSFSESHPGELTSPNATCLGPHHHLPSKSSSSVSSVFYDDRLSPVDSAYESTPGPSTRTFSEAELTSHSMKGDVLSAFSDVFEQLSVCESEIDTALLRRLRHGHMPANTETK
ncbi:serine-rich adhesin for platelets [Biomphalaria glabrata]|nr:serine-rich adhesin for platelets [Biomphalaria glabrata]